MLAIALASVALLVAAPAGASTVPAPGQTPADDTTPAAGTADTADGAGTPGDAAAVPNPYFDFGFGPGPGVVREPPPPVVVGSGADALIRLPDLQGGNDPTLLERYGAQGLSLGQDAPPEGRDPLDAVAAALFGVATWLAQIVIAAFQWAFTVEVFAFLGDAVTTIVDALRGLLYAPFVQAAVVLAGLSFVWHGMVRHRGATAVQGMVWTVVALTAAGVFFARPAAVIDAGNELSTGLSRAVLAGVSVADPGSTFADGLTTVPTYEGHPADNQLRVAGDRFWRVFVYEPWLVLQFGDPDLGAPYGERVVAARTITAEERDAVDGDAEALAALVQAKREESAALREEIVADERVAAWFTGSRPVERAGVAMLALIGVIVGGVLLVLVAAAILLAQMALLLLVLLGPVALLVGIHPGVGRVLAIRWAELAVGVLLRRVALGALLAVVLVVNGVLLEASHALGWFVVISMQALVVAAAVVYRKPFGRLFAPTTVPAVEVDGVRRVRRSVEGETIRRMAQWRETRAAPYAAGSAAPRHRARQQRRPADDLPAAPVEFAHGNGGVPVRRVRRDLRAATERGGEATAGDGAAPARSSMLRGDGSRILLADPFRAGSDEGNGTAAPTGNGAGSNPPGNGAGGSQPTDGPDGGTGAPA